AGTSVKIGDLEKPCHAGITRSVIPHIQNRLVFTDGARRKADLASLAIHLQDLELERLSLFHRVFRLVHVIFRQFRNVAKTLYAVFKFDEGSEIGESGDFPGHHVTKAVRVEELVPGVWLKILDRERESSIFNVDRSDDRFDFLIFLERL